MKNQDKAKLYGKNLAINIYNDFIEHPEYLGANWKWKNFPEFIDKHARVHCFLMFPHKVRNLDKLKVVCGSAAKKEAIKLLKSGKHLEK